MLEKAFALVKEAGVLDSNVIVSNFEQSLNAFVDIFSTFAVITISCKLVHL